MRTIPTGYRPPAQGWRATPTLGARSEMETTPTALWRGGRRAGGNGWALTVLRLGMFGRRCLLAGPAQTKDFWLERQRRLERRSAWHVLEHVDQHRSGSLDF